VKYFKEGTGNREQGTGNREQGVSERGIQTPPEILHL